MDTTHNKLKNMSEKTSSKVDELDSLIQKYQTEMLKYKAINQPVQPANAAPTVKPATPIPIPIPIPAVKPPPEDTEPPLEDTETPLDAEPRPLSNLDDVGYIQIEVVAAEQAYPIPGAIVTITKVINGVTILNEIVQTDANGKAPRIQVPAPSRQLSQHPSKLMPYATYSVTIQSPQYQTVESRNIQVFGGTVAMQIVEMIPLMESEKPNDINVVYSTPEHSLLEE